MDRVDRRSDSEGRMSAFSSADIAMFIGGQWKSLSGVRSITFGSELLIEMFWDHSCQAQRLMRNLDVQKYRICAGGKVQIFDGCVTSSVTRADPPVVFGHGPGPMVTLATVREE